MKRWKVFFCVVHFLVVIAGLCGICTAADTEFRYGDGSGDVVLASGQYIYNIPIELPAGLGDIPKLSLNYAGGGSYWTELGAGWTLEGIPYITRGTRESLPSYNQSDAGYTLEWGGSSEILTFKLNVYNQPGLYFGDQSIRDYYQSDFYVAKRPWLRLVHPDPDTWQAYDKNGTVYLLNLWGNFRAARRNTIADYGYVRP